MRHAEINKAIRQIGGLYTAVLQNLEVRHLFNAYAFYLDTPYKATDPMNQIERAFRERGWLANESQREQQIINTLRKPNDRQMHSRRGS